MQYTAKYDTWLKKSPVEASTLENDDKVLVPAGKAYPVEEVLDTTGLHEQVELGSDAGVWWLFLPHWDSGETGEITAECAGFWTSEAALRDNLENFVAFRV